MCEEQLGPNQVGPGTAEQTVLIGDNWVEGVEAQDLDMVTIKVRVRGYLSGTCLRGVVVDRGRR